MALLDFICGHSFSSCLLKKIDSAYISELMIVLLRRVSSPSSVCCLALGRIGQLSIYFNSIEPVSEGLAIAVPNHIDLNHCSSLTDVENLGIHL